MEQEENEETGIKSEFVNEKNESNDSKEEQERQSPIKNLFLKLLLYIIPICCGIVIVHLTYSSDGSEPLFFKYFIKYIGILFICIPFSNMRLIKYPIAVILFPMFILLLIVPIGGPLVSWLVSHMILLTFSIFCFQIFPEIAGYEINSLVQVYLILTTTAFLWTSFGNTIFEWSIKHIPGNQFQTIGYHIHDQKRTKFIIFLIYFVLIIYSTIYSLEGSYLLGDKKIDTAVLQSFATYIAYDRMRNALSSISWKERFISIWKEYSNFVTFGEFIMKRK